MKNTIQILMGMLAAIVLVGCSTTTIPAEPVTEEVLEIISEPVLAEAPVILEVPEVAAVPETVQPEPVKETKNMILIKTSKGDIKVELDAEKAPNTVANFLSYVESGHYNGTIFHRVIENFMIQGGGFNAVMQNTPAPRTVDNEANNGLKNDIGTIAMARTSDPHSASAQFFINTKDNDFLNFSAPTQQGWGYCVFGKVVEGLAVVKDIEGVATGSMSGFQDVPYEPIVITEVTVID